jgi:hypothetical protein
MIKKAEEEQHLGNNRSHDASQIMFEKLQSKSIEREAEMNGTDEAPVPPPSQTCDDAQTTVMMPTDAKKRAAAGSITTKEPPQKMLKMSSVDEMEVEGTPPIGFIKAVQGIMDMDCCGDTVKTHELMAGWKSNYASDLSLTSPMHTEHEVCLRWQSDSTNCMGVHNLNLSAKV